MEFFAFFTGTQIEQWLNLASILAVTVHEIMLWRTRHRAGIPAELQRQIEERLIALPLPGKGAKGHQGLA